MQAEIAEWGRMCKLLISLHILSFYGILRIEGRIPMDAKSTGVFIVEKRKGQNMLQMLFLRQRNQGVIYPLFDAVYIVWCFIG